MALENNLTGRPDIGRAARSALRSQAHALDLAEAALDPELITTVNAGYLSLLKANGLTSDQQDTGDPFERLMADLGRAAAPAGDTPQP